MENHRISPSLAAVQVLHNVQDKNFFFCKILVLYTQKLHKLDMSRKKSLKLHYLTKSSKSKLPQRLLV